MTTVHRIPVESRGKRVQGLYKRSTERGEVFEYRARLDGRVVTRKLEARTRNDAIAEVERLRTEARRTAAVP